MSVAAEWSAFGKYFYRKQEIYSMCWQKVDLRGHKVACARFGGPIAIIRDDAKIVQLRAESARPKLLIFTSSGILLASVLWDRPGGRLIGIGWTDEEILLCIMQDGTVFQYNVHGELLPEHITLGRECWEQGVADCVIWGNGLVCITEANQLFCVPDLSNPQPTKLANLNLEEPPLCMTVIEPQHTVSGHVEVLLGVGSSVFIVDQDSVQDQGILFGPLQKIAVSPTGIQGILLACFTHDGRLLVVTPDFSSIRAEFNAQSALPPDQLTWCGVDTVLLYWEETLLMVGPAGASVKYPYDEPLVLIPECDGVRILSNSYMEFLQRVPDSTLSIFSIGSTSPAAMLYDALDHFDRRSIKADENLTLISSSLSEAVECCINAAGHEFDISQQRTLMRAASYGHAFCSGFPRDRFPQMCKILRVLNAVRRFEIGIPLTIQQLKVLTEPVLIARLVNAYRHLLAFRISEYLGLGQETVLVHWACSKIKVANAVANAVPDTSLLDVILDKLKTCPGIPYAAVAAYAHKSGRRKLAALLLDYEPRSGEQVPLLVSMGEEERALQKAIESGDTDLVYFTIFHLWQKKPVVEFFRIIQGKQLARDLFVSYARQNEPTILREFFLSSGQPQCAAEILLKEAWQNAENPATRQGSSLQGPRLRLLEEAQDLYTQTKEHSFEAKAIEEHAKLLKVQQELETRTGQPIFVDSSISDTIRTCIVLGNHQDAQRIRVLFKVPDKRFYWLKVLGLATAKKWEALEKFSKERRPPVGYKPFAEACIEEGENAEALKYITKLSDPQEKAEMFARIGMAKEAAEASSQAKDGEFLGRLRSTFGQNTAAASLLDTLWDRLSLQTA